jgi:hypothetical protein
MESSLAFAFSLWLHLRPPEGYSAYFFKKNHSLAHFKLINLECFFNSIFIGGIELSLLKCWPKLLIRAIPKVNENPAY